MEAYSDLLVVALVSLAAAMSPGPNFCIVVKNSLSQSRQAGLMTAFGISLALIIHLSYTLIGIGVIIAKTPLLYAILKYVGGGYLFYVGLTSFIDSFKKPPSIELNVVHSRNSLAKAFVQGFLTNLLNPKATLFFVSLFSQFIEPTTPTHIRIQYGIVNWSVVMGWYLGLTYLITSKHLHADRFRVYTDKIMGIVLMMFGLRLVFLF